MSNPETLMPVSELNARLTPEQRRANASKAGIASGEARRKKATLRELFKLYGSMPDPEHKDRTNNESMVVNQYKLAKSDKPGSTQAAAFIRDTSGEKPHDVVETPNIDVKPLVDLAARKKNGE